MSFGNITTLWKYVMTSIQLNLYVKFYGFRVKRYLIRKLSILFCSFLLSFFEIQVHGSSLKFHKELPTIQRSKRYANARWSEAYQRRARNARSQLHYRSIFAFLGVQVTVPATCLPYLCPFQYLPSPYYNINSRVDKTIISAIEDYTRMIVIPFFEVHSDSGCLFITKVVIYNLYS